MWYYTKDEVALGPFTLEQLKSHPDVQPETFVWREGLPNWLPFREIKELKPIVPLTPGLSPIEPLPSVDPIDWGETETCSSCLEQTPINLMTMVPDKWICMKCRPVWEQRVREAVDWRNDPKNNVAGFAARAYGYVFENIVWGIVYITILLTYSGIFLKKNDPDDTDQITAILIFAVPLLIAAVIKVLFEMWMIGAKGSSMGHRTTGLKVVVSNGKRPSYGISFLRSAINTACVLFPPVFISILIDGEGRAPADFFLGTRIVYNRK